MTVSQAKRAKRAAGLAAGAAAAAGGGGERQQGQKQQQQQQQQEEDESDVEKDEEDERGRQQEQQQQQQRLIEHEASELCSLLLQPLAKLAAANGATGAAMLQQLLDPSTGKSSGSRGLVMGAVNLLAQTLHVWLHHCTSEHMRIWLALHVAAAANGSSADSGSDLPQLTATARQLLGSRGTFELPRVRDAWAAVLAAEAAALVRPLLNSSSGAGDASGSAAAATPQRKKSKKSAAAGPSSGSSSSADPSSLLNALLLLSSSSSAADGANTTAAVQRVQQHVEQRLLPAYGADPAAAAAVESLESTEAAKQLLALLQLWQHAPFACFDQLQCKHSAAAAVAVAAAASEHLLAVVHRPGLTTDAALLSSSCLATALELLRRLGSLPRLLAAAWRLKPPNAAAAAAVGVTPPLWMLQQRSVTVHVI